MRISCARSTVPVKVYVGLSGFLLLYVCLPLMFFGRAVPIRIAGPEVVSRLVTDAQPLPDIADMLAEAGISVTMAV